MLKLYNKEHEVLSALTNLKDYKIEYVLSGEDLLEFSLSRYDENIPLIEEECYIRTKYNEYVIKAIEPSDNFKRFTCNINIESLVGKVIKNFDTKNNNINDTIRLAISGTGWILADNNITKRRTVTLKNTNALEVLRKVREAFRVDFRFDAINKIIYVYEKLGSDKGVYFTDELNLISLDVPSDSYDYATRLYCYGKDGLNISSVNGGKEYIDNFQYSNKIIELIWEDNRYTDVNSLKEDAEAKLEELSKPRRNYNVQVYDLAKNNSEFSFLDFSIGDTVTIMSNLEKFKDKQRIVKYIEYPEDPSQNTCELGNTTLTFEELQKENEAKNQVVDNITSDNGTLDGSKVDSITTEQITDFEAEVAKITDLTVINAEITNLKAQNVTITGKLNAIEGEFGTLKANIGVIDKLTVTHTAQINDLKANSATITQLEAVSAKIGTVEAEVGKIQTLVNGNLSSENIQAGGITSDKLTIANGFITNAMISNLDVSKINAGDISTNKFKIKSDDGGIEIVGATQQFKDKNNRVRIQMGKDTQGNFNFIIRGEDGQSVLIDHTGVKANAIADNLIVGDMISQDTVGEKQINYSSFATGFNKDTNTSTIKSTKIMLNNQNQTLEVAFNSLKTQADGTKSLTESHSTTIGVMQGQITTAINNTQIVKDGQTILLKDDYNRTVATVDSMKSTIGSHTTTLDQHTGKITGVETRVNTVERDLNSITARVSSTEKNVTTVTNTANTAKTQADKAVVDAKTASDKATTAQNTANSATNLAKAMNNGKILYTDSNFRKGLNRVDKYANSNSTNVTITRITKPSDCPSTSTHCIEIKHIGSASPGFGGFVQSIVSRSNAVFIQKFIAKVPTGYTLNTASNSMGTGYTDKWLTSNKGTGKWEEYIREVRCGSTGTFSNGGYIYLNGSPAPTTSKPVVWYLAYCTAIDITDNDESVNNLTTEISSTKSKVSSIETNLSSITSRVSTVENKQTTTDGKVTSLETWKKSAEVKITDSAIVSTVTKSATYKNDLNGKVSSNSIISSINQTAEAIKISASKLELSGYATFTNLSTSGQTVINADNLKTGTIEALQIKACHFSGKNMVYIENDGILSCDGNTYLKNLFIPETHPGWIPGTIGTFSCAPNAYFNRDIHVTNEIYTRGTGVVRRQNGVFIQIDAIGVQNTNDKNWMLINCYQSDHVFGVDLWYSDISLKENIVNIDKNKDVVIYDNKKTGLDLINSIDHFSYNYKEDSGLGTEHIDCGYIAQQLKEVNPSLVREVPQQDGSVLLEPRASMIIPHLSKAIQEQQTIISKLEKMIQNQQLQINNLRTIVS